MYMIAEIQKKGTFDKNNVLYSHIAMVTIEKR